MTWLWIQYGFVESSAFAPPRSSPPALGPRRRYRKGLLTILTTYHAPGSADHGQFAERQHPSPLNEKYATLSR